MIADSTLAAGVVQALSTVAAVAVGYALSALSERKARQTALETANRERRLGTLVALIDSLSNLGDAATACSNALADYPIEGDESATAVERRRAALATARRAVEDDLSETVREDRQVGRLSLTVQLLSFAPELQAEVEVARRRSGELTNSLGQLFAGSTQAMDDLRSQISAIGASQVALLELGRRLT